MCGLCLCVFLCVLCLCCGSWVLGFGAWLWGLAVVLALGLAVVLAVGLAVGLYICFSSCLTTPEKMSGN